MLDNRIICVETKEIYNSIMDASRALNINRHSIGKVCGGIRKTAGGYKFMRLEDYNKSSEAQDVLIDDIKTNIANNNIANNNIANNAENNIENNIENTIDISEENTIKSSNAINPIICVETKEVYDGVMDASRKLNINRNSIGKVCRGLRKTAGGLTFMYLSDYNKLNIPQKTFIENKELDTEEITKDIVKTIDKEIEPVKETIEKPVEETVEETIEELLDDKIVDEMANEDMKVVNLDLTSGEEKTQEEWFELWLKESKYNSYAEFEKDIKLLWQEVQRIGRKISRRERFNREDFEM